MLAADVLARVRQQGQLSRALDRLRQDALLLRRAHTVWVQAQPQEHMNRVIAQGDLRPMAGSGGAAASEAMEDLKRILVGRAPFYGKADMSFDTTGKSLDDMYAKTRAQGFGAEVKRRILIGTYVLSHGYYDAYYLQAQKIRRMIADDFQAAFQQCDLIAGPVAPSVAPQLGAQTDPVSSYLADIYTLPASLAGLPGMSVPAGFGGAGLPVGLQLIGNYFQEGRLLNAAHQLQLATDHHLRRPEGF
mgnify:CR=1 FL=1